jgi:sigma-B regulation protein RsbU (phosphoserine phosphatase)
MKVKKLINIFIVDDNVIFSLALKTSIENAFKDELINVYSFNTGEECLAGFKKLGPDIIILDYHLNSKALGAADGLVVLDKIKKINAETSVIILTSNDHIDTALKSFHYGASDYVIKTENPFEKINLSISKIFTHKENDFIEKEKRRSELVNANKELVFQNEEKNKRAAELIIVNKLNAEVENSNRIMEEKNRNITDSINYAKRIQEAQLPRMDEIFAAFPECFVLFKPKDIVSGDFYFFHKNNESVFIVAADCTGHGVPGAFMSMIGSEKLEEALAHSSDTSEILKHLNKGIKNSLHQSEDSQSTRDGMDIAICSVDTKNRIVKYAGANRPLWIIRKGESSVEEIKATKKAIGGFTENEQHFENHELKLRQGDTFYITTDGYADQFGAEYGKKLMTKKFKEILLNIQDKTMREQEKHLDNYIEDWKGITEQVDDILVVGVRL